MFLFLVFLINVFEKNNTHNGCSSIKIEHRAKCYLKKVCFLVFFVFGKFTNKNVVFLFCFVKSFKYKEQAGWRKRDRADTGVVVRERESDI